MFSSHVIGEEMLIRLMWPFRPPVLKGGQCDPVKVQIDSFEVVNILYAHCLPGVYLPCSNS